MIEWNGHGFWNEKIFEFQPDNQISRRRKNLILSGNFQGWQYFIFKKRWIRLKWVFSSSFVLRFRGLNKVSFSQTKWFPIWKFNFYEANPNPLTGKKITIWFSNQKFRMHYFQISLKGSTKKKRKRWLRKPGFCQLSLTANCRLRNADLHPTMPGFARACTRLCLGTYNLRLTTYDFKLLTSPFLLIKNPIILIFYYFWTLIRYLTA